VSFLPVDHAPPPPSASREDFLAAVGARMGRKEATLTVNGRAAMAALFRHLQLLPEDEVFVTTTFGYPNVSACVTSTIFNYCKPSRILGLQTRAILVIHEFGAPHAGTPELRREATRRGIPLIEDCAHSVASGAPEGWRVGELADWAIVSLPKLLPVSVGGALVGPPVPYSATRHETRQMRAAAGLAAAWQPRWREHIENRRRVFRALSSRAAEVGLEPLFTVTDAVCPWFFPVEVPCPEAVQLAARELGVDCGHWHGSDAVVLPCHQFLGEDHVRRIAEVLARAADPVTVLENS
jgi:dTDP-4-amino-4,6-dideoxygalactose transaminase